MFANNLNSMEPLATHIGSAAITSADRPTGQRRVEYVPNWPPDEFIVPLLKDWIEANLTNSILLYGPACRTIDVGCGEQPFRTQIENAGGRYFSMDVHQNRVQNVDFVMAIDSPTSDALLAAGQFDILLCTEVLEHVADWRSAFAAMASLLNPGGRAIITCPHLYQLHEEPFDFFRPTTYAIEWHAHKAGLLVERIERLGNAWDALGGVIANLWPLPYRRTVLNRTLGRVLRGCLRGLLFGLLKSRWLHKTFDPNSTLYLANAAILKKP